MSPGAGQGSVTVTLKPGEQRRVEITLLGLAKPEEAPVKAPQPPEPPEPPEPTRWPWWLLGGTGVAVAAAGLATVGVGFAKRSEYEKSCPCEEATALQRRDEVRSLWITGGVLGGVGVLATGIAVSGLATSTRSAAPPAALSVSVVPGGLLLRGHF